MGAKIKPQRRLRFNIPVLPVRRSGSFFGGERGHSFSPRGRARNYLHFIPVIGKLPAAIQAHHIGSGQRSSFNTPRTFAHRNWKTVVSVPASEEHIQQTGKHVDLPHSKPAGGPYLGFVRLVPVHPSKATVPAKSIQSYSDLDSATLKKVPCW